MVVNEDKPFLLAFGNFSGAFAVKLQVGTFFLKVSSLVVGSPTHFETCHVMRVRTVVVELDHGLPLIGMSMKPPWFFVPNERYFQKKRTWL